VGTARELRPKRLGEKLAAIRNSLNLSQNELIRKLGFQEKLSREEISSFERDVRVPPPLVLLGWARLAGVHVDELLDDAIDLPSELPAKTGVGSLPGAHSKKK
jgi:Helix-turn-helix.